MLKKRIISKIVVRDGIHVQSHAYHSYLPIGCPAYSAEYASKWLADEILIVDISHRFAKTEINIPMLLKISQAVNIPITYGGGVTNLDQAGKLFNLGFEKISLNKSNFESPELANAISKQFGAQSLILSIDLIRHKGDYYVYDYMKQTDTIKLDNYLSKIDLDLYGEISFSFPTRDGIKCGYDIEFASTYNFHKPVIINSGYGTPKHISDVLRLNENLSVGIGNSAAYIEHPFAVVKGALDDQSLFRSEKSFANYYHLVDQQGRVTMPSERYLDDLIFKKVEYEII
mgnify:CR=1 FL=1